MGCREWKRGKTGSGYGAYYPPGRKQILVHRWVAECAWGPLKKTDVVCHKCDNKLCFKLEHLFIGTQADNIRDMFSKGRQHDRRGDNGNHSKLTTKQALEIKGLLGRYTYKEIADIYGVSTTAIADIKLKRTWSHI